MRLRLALLLVLFAVGAAVLSGGSLLYAQSAHAPQMAHTTITPAELAAQLKSANPPVVIDVREPDEYAEGHIDGAQLIPLSTLPQHLAEVPKDKTVVVYCRSGHRSARAYGILESQGYTKLEDLAGGYSAWHHATCTKNFC